MAKTRKLKTQMSLCLAKGHKIPASNDQEIHMYVPEKPEQNASGLFSPSPDKPPSTGIGNPSVIEGHCESPGTETQKLQETAPSSTKAGDMLQM